MKFTVQNINKSINDLMRTIGYKPTFFQKEEEFSIVRQLGRNDYPRFHIYIREVKSENLKAKNYIFNLHLDQKKSSYEGSTGHSGEYDGNVVEGEAERIRQLLI